MLGRMAQRSQTPPPGAPLPLTSMNVDVTDRLGTEIPVTTTGLPTLDSLFGGGFRPGDFVLVGGESGVGTTSLATFLGYITARAKAGTVIMSVTLDEAQLLARLAARAVHREDPDAKAPYGDIWAGRAFHDPAVDRSVRSAVATVISKVGSLLHVRRLTAFESTQAVHRAAAALWSRFDRVVVVVDGADMLSAYAMGNAEQQRIANGGEGRRMLQAAFELRAIAEGGCTVLGTVTGRNLERMSPAATIAAELGRSGGPVMKLSAASLALGTHNVELRVTKNHAGPGGIVPLRFTPGAATFEERAP